MGDMLASEVSHDLEPIVIEHRRRPKSEGSFVEDYRTKRASSFGVGIKLIFMRSNAV